MTIRLASELSFSPPPCCPVCNKGLLPYGRSEPFAVDAQGAPYCHEHGAESDPTFAATHADYKVRMRNFSSFWIPVHKS